MRYQEIICEKIDTSKLYMLATDALTKVLTSEFERPKDRLGAISSALSIAANSYTSRWKSGITNARGYELDKMHLEIICRYSFEGGASFQQSKMSDSILLSTIIIYILPEEEFEEPTLDVAYRIRLIADIADKFEHEMVHYTQTVSVKSDDSNVRAIAKRANAYPMTDEESRAMTDETRAKYLASRSEVSAYAGNAFRELQRAFGNNLSDILSTLTSDIVLAASPSVRKFATLVKPNYPKAWNSFKRQIAQRL